MTAQTWIIFILVGLVGWGGLIMWRLFAARRHAGEIFDALAKKDKSVRELGEDGFRNAYMRAHGPRPALYAFVASIVALALLPIFYNIAAWIWQTIWIASDRPADLEQGLIPWTLYMMVMIMAGWAGVAGAFARLYHWNRPQTLDVEVQRELDART
ncbi:MAG: hypothetical protein AAF719_13065 [Pseudomonadota bacterium]